MSGLVTGGWWSLVWVVPLEVYPDRGNGFAAAIVGALVALGLLVLIMMFISSKPKGRRGRDR